MLFRSEIMLDKEQQANFLNKNGTVTAINFKGWRCWGSETAKNPLATDPKDKFGYTRRMFKYIGNELANLRNSKTKKFLSSDKFTVPLPDKHLWTNYIHYICAYNKAIG